LDKKSAPESQRRPISAEDRVARFINVTMVSLLGATALGFMLWSVAIEFGAVRGIYNSLPAQEQSHVSRLFDALAMLTLGISVASQMISGWIKQRRTASGSAVVNVPPVSATDG